MRRVAAEVRTNIIILRVSHRPRREISSVHRVNLSRECCTRKPLAKLLSSSSASLCVSRRGRRSWFAHSSAGVARPVRCPSVIVNDIPFPALFDFEHHIELTVHYDFHCLSECRFEVNIDAQLAMFCTRWQYDPSDTSMVKSKPNQVYP